MCASPAVYRQRHAGHAHTASVGLVAAVAMVERVPGTQVPRSTILERSWPEFDDGCCSVPASAALKAAASVQCRCPRRQLYQGSRRRRRNTIGLFRFDLTREERSALRYYLTTSPHERHTSSSSTPGVVQHDCLQATVNKHPWRICIQ